MLITYTIRVPRTIIATKKKKKRKHIWIFYISIGSVYVQTINEIVFLALWTSVCTINKSITVCHDFISVAISLISYRFTRPNNRVINEIIRQVYIALMENGRFKFTTLYFVSEKRIVFEFISYHINTNPILALIELSAK